MFLDRFPNESEDVKKEEEKKFKEVGEAYAVLSDAKKRARYDNGQDLEDMGSGMSGAGKTNMNFSNKNVYFVLDFFSKYFYCVFK